MTLVYEFIKDLITKNKMYTITFYFFLGALFATANIVIMNEETIVAICFVLFIITLYVYGRTTVTESLAERTQQISQEFDSFYSLHVQNIELLISYYNKQNDLLEKVTAISSFTKDEIKTVISKKEHALNASISAQIEQKLNTILAKEMAIIAGIQSEIVKLFTNEIREMFIKESPSQKQLKVDVTNESISKLGMLTSK